MKPWLSFFILASILWSIAVLTKIARGWGQPFAVYKFASWDGGVMLRHRSLRRGGAALLGAVALGILVMGAYLLAMATPMNR